MTCIVRHNHNMQFEKIVHDTQDFTNRVQEVFGPQWLEEPATLVAELGRVIGVLAESTLVTEGKRPERPARPVRLAHDVADVLFMLIAISNHYHINLEQAWNELLQEGWENLTKLERGEIEINKEKK